MTGISAPTAAGQGAAKAAGQAGPGALTGRDLRPCLRRYPANSVISS